MGDIFGTPASLNKINQTNDINKINNKKEGFITSIGPDSKSDDLKINKYNKKSLNTDIFENNKQFYPLTDIPVNNNLDNNINNKKKKTPPQPNPPQKKKKKKKKS